MQKTVKLRIKRNSPHPWVYRRMVGKFDKNIPAGSVVQVVDRGGEKVGQGFFHPRSNITLRMLTDRSDLPVDESFFRERIGKAIELRRDLLNLEDRTDAWRVLHSEADGLSGLILDKFANVLVGEIFSAGIMTNWEMVESALRAHFPEHRIYLRTDEKTVDREGVRIPDAMLPRGTVTIHENDVSFHVDLEGQKTGFFLDQRENRLRFSRLVEDKRVLDAFCYSGGFGIYAAKRGKPASVEGVDLAETALETAAKNASLNGVKIDYYHADVFDFFRKAKEENRTWDRIILDPPKFVRNKAGLHAGYQGYLDINRMAMERISDGGLLLTCSCSGLVSDELFTEALWRASNYAGCKLQVLEFHHAGADHPTLAQCPETGYLKAALCRVLKS